MALSANTNIKFMEPDSHRPKVSHAVLGSAHIYHGAYVGMTPSGYDAPHVPGYQFVGIADEEYNNSSTTDGATSVLGSDGERGKTKCRIITGGHFIGTVTSVAITDVGKPVYATADDTLSLTGHPDSFVGIITAKYDTNLAIIRMRSPGQLPPNDGSNVLVDIDFARFFVPSLDEGLDNAVVGQLFADLVGAGLTAGSSGLIQDTETGEARLLLDNDNEAENITVRTNMVFNVTKGITFLLEGRLKTAGGAATDDVDFGLYSLSGGLTDTERADLEATTAGAKRVLFHLNANANDIFVGADDDTTVVASTTDTTVNNSLSANKSHLLIVPPTGLAQLWVDGVRYLASTALSVGTSGLFAAVVSNEKSTGTGVPEFRIRRIRAAGALA